MKAVCVFFETQMTLHGPWTHSPNNFCLDLQALFFSSRFTSEGCQDFCCLVLTLCLYTMFSLCSLGPAGFIIRAGFKQHQAHLQRFPSNPNFPTPSQCSPSLPPTTALQAKGDYRRKKLCLPLLSTVKLASSSWL